MLFLTTFFTDWMRPLLPSFFFSPDVSHGGLLFPPVLNENLFFSNLAFFYGLSVPSVDDSKSALFIMPFFQHSSTDTQ